MRGLVVIGLLLGMIFPSDSGFAEQTKLNLQSALGELGFAGIPLRRSPDNHLYRSGTIDGHRASFLVDTGWSETTVNRAENPSAGTRHEIELGAMTFNEQSAKQQRVLMGGQAAAFDVVLGLDFLRRHGAVIDCGGAKLFIFASKKATSEAELSRVMQRGGFIAVPLQIKEAQALTCPGRVADKGFEMLVDSGAAWTCLDLHKVKPWGLKPKSSTTRVSGAGKTGNRSLAVAELDALWIGEFRIARRMVGLVELRDWGLGVEGSSLKAVSGLLGGDLLAEYQAVIDCSRLKLWLKPRANR